MTAMAPTDPILIKRARASRLAELGQRIGYLFFAIAITIFFVGLATNFNSIVSRLVVVGLIAGSIVLAPAIITGYAVKAAIRDDREHGRELS